jgi:signal transduction histidine kinase
MADSSGFVDRFLKKLRKIDPDQIEGFIHQMLREKALLEEVIDQLDVGVILTDRQGRIHRINHSACQFFTTRRQECEGKLLSKAPRLAPLRELQEEFETLAKPILSRELTLLSPTRRLLSVSLHLVEPREGEPGHTLWLLSDRTEEDRRADQRQQVDRIQALAALTAGVAHEVKNPLNSMGIHAQIIRSELRRLADTHNVERLEHSAEVMLEEIKRLARIVDDFSRAVRPTRPQLRREDVNKVLRAVADLVAPECDQRGIDLILTMDSEVPPLEIDPEQLQQALLNLVKNAMEAMDKPEGRITLRSDLRPDHVLIEVEDNGCGIPEKDRLKIFEPYHTTKFDGTGLGLMVVYRIVRALNGALGLRSDEGKGSVFTIALPIDERPVRLLSAQVEPPLLTGE